MCCGYKTIRALSIFFNSLFLLNGAGLVAVGAWVVADFASFSAILAGSSSVLFQYAAYACIGVGCFIMFVAFLGCCGAWKENGCMLVTFSIILILLLILEVVILVFAFLFFSQVDTFLSGAALNSIRTIYGTTDTQGTAATIAWNLAHVTFSCCGYHNGYDFTGSVYDQGSSNAMPWPDSCCKISNGAFVDAAQCVAGNNALYSYGNTGCVTALKDLINKYTPALGAIAAAIMLVQLLAIVFACKIKKGKNSVHV